MPILGTSIESNERSTGRKDDGKAGVRAGWYDSSLQGRTNGTY